MSLWERLPTDPCRSLFSGILTLYSDNANVNITNIANKFIAMTEVPVPVEFDPNTLETLGVTDYDDRIPGNLTTAHPHYDFVKKEGVNYMTHLSSENTYNIYRIKTGMKRELTASVKVKEPSYMHSFGLTEHYVILVEFPLMSPITPLNDLGSGKTLRKA
jgi:beta,beta-carotene 9',10'-dioxygenase